MLAASDPKILAPLEPFATTGVPTAAVLARELLGLTPALPQAAGAPGARRRFLEKLQAGAEKLVRIRPLDEVAGNDPAAIVARIEVKASQADISGALAELAKLPAVARAPAEAWIKKAQLRAPRWKRAAARADALSGLSKYFTRAPSSSGLLLSHRLHPASRVLHLMIRVVVYLVIVGCLRSLPSGSPTVPATSSSPGRAGASRLR